MFGQPAAGGPPPVAAPPLQPVQVPPRPWIRKIPDFMIGVVLGLFLASAITGVVLVADSHLRLTDVKGAGLAGWIMTASSTAAFVVLSALASDPLHPFSRLRDYPSLFGAYFYNVMTEARPRHFAYAVAGTHFTITVCEFLVKVSAALATWLGLSCVVVSAGALIIAVFGFRLRPTRIACVFLTAGFAIRICLFIRKGLHLPHTLATCIVGCGSDLISSFGTWLANQLKALSLPSSTQEAIALAQIAIHFGRHKDAIRFLRASPDPDDEEVRGLLLQAKERLLYQRGQINMAALQSDQQCVGDYCKSIVVKYSSV